MRAKFVKATFEMGPPASHFLSPDSDSFNFDARAIWRVEDVAALLGVCVNRASRLAIQHKSFLKPGLRNTWHPFQVRLLVAVRAGILSDEEAAIAWERERTRQRRALLQPDADTPIRRRAPRTPGPATT